MTRTFPIVSVGFLLTGHSLAAINNGIAYGCDDMDPDFANQAEHGELADWLYDTAPIEAYLRERGIDGLQCISGVDGSAETFDNVLCGEDGLEVTFDDDLVAWLPMQQEAAWVGKAPYDTTAAMERPSISARTAEFIPADDKRETLRRWRGVSLLK